MKRALAGCAAMLVCMALAPSAQAALRFGDCEGFECARVTVPLDHSGRVEGQLSLFVKRVREEPGRRSLPPVILLDEAPAESATDAPDGESLNGLNLSLILESGNVIDRDVVVFDQRGTGASGRLSCPSLERTNLLNARDEAADCARSIGPARAFYTTQDSVNDLEAVRRALGVPRVALFAVGSGAKLAAAYSFQHPERVERIALDSPVELGRPDPLGRDSLRATYRVLRSVCRRRCREITRDPIRDIERLVAALRDEPLRGPLVGSSGRPRTTELGSPRELFDILLAGDLDSVLRSASPAAVRSALEGDAAPILRLRRRARQMEHRFSRDDATSASAAAMTCDDALVPWPRTTPFSDRAELARRRVGSLPSTTWRPFDLRTALEGHLLRLCERWPTSSTPPRYPGPAPDVPVLVVVGADDLRTPVGSARRLAARFPRGQVLAVPAAGHAVAASQNSCALEALQRFLIRRTVARRCPPTRRESPALPIDPLSLRAVPRARGVRGNRGRALGALTATLEDLYLDSIYQSLDQLPADLDPLPFRGAGLRGGRYTSTGFGRFRLHRLSYVPGVRISGTATEDIFDQFPGDARGRLRISGPETPDGRIRLRGRRFTGVVAGRRVRGRLHFRLVGN